MKYSIPISVVMPCYNSGKYIVDAIESILSQSFTNYEFLIFNDGSNDSTYHEINRFNDKRIKCFNATRNIGNYPARNFLMRQAKGKYIAVMDADDVSLPNRLSTQYVYMERNKNIGIIGSNCNIINDSGDFINHMNKVLDYSIIKVALLSDNAMSHPTLFMRSLFLRKFNIEYNEYFTYSSDYDFIVRCSERFPVRNLDCYLINYRRHQSQISTDKKSVQSEFADEVRIKQLNKFKLDLSEKSIELYLKLIKFQYVCSDDLVLCEKILNNILETNLRLKLYNQSILFSFFDLVLNKKVVVGY